MATEDTVESLREDVLGTLSAGMNCAASSCILSGSSWPALLSICIALARLIRRFSQASIRLGIDSGEQFDKNIPIEMPSSIAWQPP